LLTWFQVAEILQSFIDDCDRKTELAKRRLKETQEELSEEAAAKVSCSYCHYLLALMLCESVYGCKDGPILSTDFEWP
jgi:nitrate/TMAO reductase-like tetraheme cytochrome c subunit